MRRQPPADPAEARIAVLTHHRARLGPRTSADYEEEREFEADRLATAETTAGRPARQRRTRNPDARCRRWRNEPVRELKFFRKNRSRKRYRELRDRKLWTGSGIVEAANKAIGACRMKGSGMHRSMVGGQAVLTFKALIKSGGLERA